MKKSFLLFFIAFANTSIRPNTEEYLKDVLPAINLCENKRKTITNIRRLIDFLDYNARATLKLSLVLDKNNNPDIQHFIKTTENGILSCVRAAIRESKDTLSEEEFNNFLNVIPKALKIFATKNCPKESKHCQQSLENLANACQNYSSNDPNLPIIAFIRNTKQ